MRTGNKINMFAMQGFCPRKVFIDSMPMALKSLTYANDKDVQALQTCLLSFIYQKIFKQTRKYENGFVLHSGSEANEIALFLAKQRCHKKRNMVLTTNLSHSSIQNACHKLDLEMLVLNVRPDTFQVDVQELVDILKKRHGQILALNMTCGTTQLGISEDVILDGQIQRLIKKNNIWLHVDAAYGGYVLNLSNRLQSEWNNVFQVADSISVDPHKFAATWGCGVLLLKNADYKKFVGPETNYYSGVGTALGTTRSAFPATTAMKIAEERGIKGLKKLSDDCYKKAEFIVKKLEQEGIELITKIQSPNIPIKMKSEKMALRMEKQLRENNFLVSQIIIISKDYKIYGLRICITPRSDVTWRNIRLFVKSFIEIYKKLSSSIK